MPLSSGITVLVSSFGLLRTLATMFAVLVLVLNWYSSFSSGLVLLWEWI